MTHPSLLAAPPAFFDTLSESGLADLQSRVSPTVGILLDGPAPPDQRAAALDTLSRLVETTANMTDSSDSGIYSPADSAVDIVVATDDDALSRVTAAEAEHLLSTDTETYIASSQLALTVDKTSLHTSLDGLSAYRTTLETDSLTGSYTHLSTRITAGYTQSWGELTVTGLKPDTSGYGSEAAAALHTLYPDGTVASTTYTADQLGLQALDTVGPKRAASLAAQGFTTRADIAAASADELTDISGIGETTATTLTASATAIADGCIVRTSRKPVPGTQTDPVYIDIETDGLNPSTIWLIGALDSATGEYHSFLQTDPTADGKAVAEFLSWLTVSAIDRPLIAWNGHAFDYPVLTEHIDAHVPDYSDMWDAVTKRDLLYWARDNDNAILPGLTNTLDDVASALGFDRSDTGLTGEIVAKRYRAWMDDQSPATELDWDSHEQYCRDDVESLAHVHEALIDAPYTTAGDEFPGVQDTDAVQTSSLTQY